MPGTLQLRYATRTGVRTTKTHTLGQLIALAQTQEEVQGWTDTRLKRRTGSKARHALGALANQPRPYPSSACRQIRASASCSHSVMPQVSVGVVYQCFRRLLSSSSRSQRQGCHVHHCAAQSAWQHHNAPQVRQVDPLKFETLKFELLKFDLQNCSGAAESHASLVPRYHSTQTRKSGIFKHQNTSAGACAMRLGSTGSVK